MKIAGAVLIVLGLIGLASGSISFTSKEKVVDIGPLEVTKENRETHAIPIAASIGALGAGAAMLLSGALGRKA